MPAVTFNILPAQQDVGNYPHRTLVIGQMDTGSATSGDLNPDIGNDGEWNALFGIDSQISAVIKAFRAINPITPLDAIAFEEDADGTAGTGIFTFAGEATAGGTITVVVGSQKENKYTLVVSAEDTATEVGDLLEAKITADTNSLFTADNSAGAVTITAKSKGTFVNGLTLEVRDLPAGITCTLTAISNGAGDPDLEGIEDTMDGHRWQGILYPGTWDLETIDTLMDGRFNVTNDVVDGVVFMAKAASYGTLATWLSSANQPLLVGYGFPAVDRAGLKGCALREVPDVIAAKFQAIRALRLTDGANVAPFVVGTDQGRDQFGGMHMASLPYFNTPLLDVPLITKGDGFSRVQMLNLKAAGVSSIGNNIANNTVIVGEVCTTYMTDVAGNPNTSFKFLEYVDTLSQIREYYFNNCRAKYAQCRLTDAEGLIPGFTMANKASIKAFLCSLYLDLGEVVLARAGEANLKFYRDNLDVTLDLANGRVSIDMMMPIVVQLREILGNIRVTFNTDGSL
jgi:phage tail sheath gpL-like